MRKNRKREKQLIIDIKKHKYALSAFAHNPEGSEGSAAGGGESDLSEWLRSADEEAALSETRMPGIVTVLEPIEKQQSGGLLLSGM